MKQLSLVPEGGQYTRRTATARVFNGSFSVPGLASSPRSPSKYMVLLPRTVVADSSIDNAGNKPIFCYLPTEEVAAGKTAEGIVPRTLQSTWLLVSVSETLRALCTARPL